MSTLMFWNKQNSNGNQNGSENGSAGKNGRKTWLHSPESLMNGHVAYLVKVSGSSFIIVFLLNFLHFLISELNQRFDRMHFKASLNTFKAVAT